MHYRHHKILQRVVAMFLPHKLRKKFRVCWQNGPLDGRASETTGVLILYVLAKSFEAFAKYRMSVVSIGRVWCIVERGNTEIFEPLLKLGVGAISETDPQWLSFSCNGMFPLHICRRFK